MCGTSTISFSANVYSYIVYLAPRKDESLSAGFNNSLTCAFALCLYFISSQESDDPHYATETILYAMYASHFLALVLLQFVEAAIAETTYTEYTESEYTDAASSRAPSTAGNGEPRVVGSWYSAQPQSTGKSFKQSVAGRGTEAPAATRS